MRGRRRQWTEEALRSAVAAHANCTDVSRALALRPAGGNHRTVRGYVERLAPDASHLTDENRLPGLRASHRLRTRPEAEVFCQQNAVTQHVLRQHARRSLLPIVCAECGNRGSRSGKPLVLHLAHLNGVHNDHRRVNLRGLRPDCHSQTGTYAGRKTRVTHRARRSKATPSRPGEHPVA